jgi:hemerythrin
MSIFAWSEKYSVNIREIDDQHKKLIGMVNQLHDAMRQGHGKQALDKVLKDLIQYTRTHFAAEERIMKTNGYPEYEVHKAKHDKMTDKVANIYRDYQDGKVSMTLDVMTFLENWVDKHIMSTDKQYMPYLNGKGVN